MDGTSGSAAAWLGALFEVFTPRRVCMYGEPDVVWLHVVADSGIAVAYFAIPFVLVLIARRRPDLVAPRTFRLFAAFIFACGTTHVFDVWAMWQPLYRVDGLMKLWTAVISLVTAVHLWRQMPLALSLPSGDSLRRVNAALEQQVAQRDAAESALRSLNADLEERVRVRTAELEALNEQLRAEIEQRRVVEEERTRLLAAEKTARAEAEHASRVKDEFLAVLSHELRTPLNAILGWTVLMREQRADPRVAARGLEVIERNARAQADLVATLLDMSAILAGRLQLDRDAVSMREIVLSVIESVRPLAEANELRLTTSLDVERDAVDGDRVRLAQVVTNLVGNALKFTPPGGSVDVSLVRDGDVIELRVRDTGVGIDPSFAPHAFERFRQADSSSTRAHGGLGLGLAIARHLVDAHGGTVRAESEGLGRGATFVVRLPAAERDAERAPERARPARLDGLAVLVVDDHQDSLDLVAAVLEAAGAEVAHATSAAEARGLLDARDFDVVVSDLGMPGESGHAVARALRASERHAHVAAIALSALVRDEDRSGALEAGFDLHVGKPATPAELVDAVVRARRVRA